MKRYAYILILLSALVYGCKKNITEPSPDLGLDYFPNEVGFYTVYQVDSIVFNVPFNKIDTFKFQLKEWLESTYTDSEEKQTTRIVRMYRNNATESWTIKNIWAQRVVNLKAERQEENIRLTKLIFPLKKNLKWNINSGNTLEPQNAKVEEFDVEFELDGKEYPKVCFVNVETDTNLIAYKKHHEYYARQIGLIYSEYFDVQSNTINAGKPSVLQRIETGVICKKRILEYGKL